MRLTAIPRMTVGLVSLAVMLLLVFDALLGLFPTDAQTRRNVNLQVANALAAQTAALLPRRDWRALDQTLHNVLVAQGKDLASIGLRRADGSLLVQAGTHPASWNAGSNGQDITVVLTANDQRWGQLELAFHKPSLADLPSWALSGPVRMVLLFGVLATLLYYLYLRRVLEHLDPSAAVPDRVRSAFDTLVEGVMVVDAQGRILLVNKAFEALRPASDTKPLLGQRAQALTWLQPSDPATAAAPWMEAMQQRHSARGLAFVVRDPHERGAAQTQADQTGGLEPVEPRAHVVLNCSPLTDEQGGLRGCLVSLGDVTELEMSHRQLLEVLADLAASKQELEHKNRELEQLASQDILSGCLNRRAFFELGDGLFRRALRDGSPLVCVMADIDHFKKINDTWGHAVGDQAIKRFAALLRQHVRPGDLLGRYGGEEFCLVLFGATPERGQQLAEALRSSVASNRGQGLDPGERLNMTASFGLAAMTEGVNDLAALIDLADRAMYVAKHGGRNRVVVYQADQQTTANDAATRPQESVT
ncbi:MAG: GGDEF domain-containing protein [Rubrivivax sp.]|jgi:diguanylate cyclase (GGDEF)-like protein|nr:GGDEF domain-containing protein [Rubrivivax sp.]